MRGRILAAVALALGVAGPAAAEEPVEIVPPANRDVTAPGMTPGPPADGLLVREKVPPPPPDPPRWHRFDLVETIDAATFRVKEKIIRISGAAAPSPGAICGPPGAEAWPCGRTALHAFRMFLRGRSVECYYPPVDADLVIAPCRVGTADLGLWLLRQGWAKPDGNATDDYRAASQGAACAGRGLWRETDRDFSCPAVAAD